MEIFFVTTNERKFEELKAIIGIPIKCLVYDIQEIQGTKEEIVIDKLKKACMKFKEKYILVDDASMDIHGLKGFPGAYGKDFLRIGNDAINEIVSKVGRETTASCILAFGYIDAKGEFSYKLFEGKIDGMLEKERIKGFKYDGMFVPKGFDKTFAELTIEEKGKISHRGKACKKLIDFLNEKYNIYGN